jgi:membrane protease YdiL (CAAX protease family)
LLGVLLGAECLLASGEEYGWRGYLLPRLLPLGELRGTLILAAIWGIWHLPVLFAGVLLGGSPLALAVTVHMAAIIAQSLPYTWLAERTGFSPALASVFHGSTNWSLQRALGVVRVVSPSIGLAFVAGAWVIVVAAWYICRPLRPSV